MIINPIAPKTTNSLVPKSIEPAKFSTGLSFKAQPNQDEVSLKRSILQDEGFMDVLATRVAEKLLDGGLVDKIAAKIAAKIAGASKVDSPEVKHQKLMKIQEVENRFNAYMRDGGQSANMLFKPIKNAINPIDNTPPSEQFTKMVATRSFTTLYQKGREDMIDEIINLSKTHVGENVPFTRWLMESKQDLGL